MSELTWAQRAKNWAVRCETTLPSCPGVLRLLERRLTSDLHVDVAHVQYALFGALIETRRQRDAAHTGAHQRELLDRIREAERLLYQYEHRERLAEPSVGLIADSNVGGDVQPGEETP